MKSNKRIVILLIILGIVSFFAWMIGKKESSPLLFEDTVENLPQKVGVDLENYMPVTKDRVWLYESPQSSYGEVKIFVDYTKDNVFQLRIKGEDFNVAKVIVQEEDIIYEVAQLEEAKIKQDYTQFRMYKDILLKTPIEEGQSWMLSDGAVRTITYTDQTLNTPLGSQQVIQVTTKHPDYELKTYYGEKIGIVRLTYEDDNTYYKIDLTQVENNKPQNEIVTVYLPNKTTHKLTAVMQSVSVMTNEEPKHFLTDLLKRGPNESYIPSIPEEAVINTIYLDEEDQCVYLDMSKEYLSMETEGNLRPILVQSLVDTIGNYYHVSEVVMTVEGETYPIRAIHNNGKGRYKVSSLEK